MKIDSGSGLVDVGFVAAVEATAKVLTEETTLGNLPVGWDEAIKWEMKQTDGASWQAILGVPFPASVQAQGNNDFATLFLPTVTPDLDKKFDGKTGSKITCTAEFKGASKTQAMGFITNAS